MKQEIVKCSHCGKMMEKHIDDETQKRHTIYWDVNGTHCTEKNCEVNHGIGKCVNRK